MEVELKQKSHLVDLELTPGENGDSWEVKRIVSQPTVSYPDLS